MSKNSLLQGFSTIVIIIIAALVLLAGGVFIMNRDSGPDEASSRSGLEESAEVDESEILEGETRSTLPEIIGRGQSLECDWRMPIEEGEENPFDTGKLYTTGSKGRSMMTGNISGAAFEGNAIYKDNEVYTWMSVGGNTFGFKFSEETLKSEAADMTPEERQQAEQISAEMVFNCVPWSPDESLFQLPEGVEFSTL